MLSPRGESLVKVGYFLLNVVLMVREFEFAVKLGY